MCDDSRGGALVGRVLAAFTASPMPSTPRTAPEVAAELDEPLQATTTALAALTDRDELASRVPASGERVWWRPPSGRRGDGDGSPTGRREEPTRSRAFDAFFRRVTRRVVGAADRESLERAVCKDLAGIGRYRFVVCGESAGSGGGTTARASAGIPASEVDATLERVGRSSPDAGSGRTGGTGDLRIVQRLEDAPPEPWADVAAHGGAGSYAVVPLCHDGIVDGVLCVGADRPDAFEEADREFLADLGRVVGYAIGALERPTVWEFETELVLVSDVLPRAFFGTDGDDGTGRRGRIEIDVDSIVPLDDGTHLQYWELTGVGPATAVEGLAAMGTTLDARLVSTVEDVNRIEIHTATESVFTVLDEFDGRLVSAVVDEGAFRATARIRTGVDARVVRDAVRELYPSVELASYRKVVSDTYLRRIVEESLTERQATALRVAYAGGYFRQPRDSTGDELAARLGISRQTFNHHLRKAEAKVFEAVFDPDEQG